MAKYQKQYNNFHSDWGWPAWPYRLIWPLETHKIHGNTLNAFEHHINCLANPLTIGQGSFCAIPQDREKA